MNRLSRRVVAALLFLSAAIFCPAQEQPLALHYNFRAGDHLVYRETFEREGKSSEQTFRTRVVFLNHLVVVDVVGGSALVGVQRNRQSAELLEYREGGKDRLSQQRAGFEQRMSKRAARVFDTNLYTTAGLPQLPLQIEREATSDLLYGVSEIPALPATAIQDGAEWKSANFGLTMRLGGREMVAGESCVTVEDTGGRRDMHLAFTFCPESGHLAKLTFTGQYGQIGDSTVIEHLSLELVEARSGENAGVWLNDPEVQRGALDAYVTSGTMPSDTATLTRQLRADDPEVQSLVLAVFLQHHAAPPADTLAQLESSRDAQVRRIAARFVARAAAEKTGACPLPTVKHPREKPGTTLRSIAEGSFAGTPYIVHVPIDYRADQPFPVIVYLSGGGGRALDAAHTAEDTLRNSGYIAIYPQAGGMWWDPQPTQMVDALLLQVQREYNVGTNRVYLTGFSNGGTGALYYATLWPDRFAAVSLLMGAGVETPASQKPALMNLWNLPVLLLHGDKDERIPFAASTATYDQVRGLHPRVAPELHILKGRGHDITLDADDRYTLPFFERFTRELAPSQITASFAGLQWPRQYWVEIVEKGNGSAQVDARMQPGGIIDLKAKNVAKLRLLLRPEMFPEAATVRVRVNGKELPPHTVTRDCAVFSKSAQRYGDADLAYTDEIVVDVSK